MKGKRFTEEQIIGVLNEAEQTGDIREVCRQHNISEQTFYRWRTKFDGMDISEAKRLKELERENAELKKMVAEQAQNGPKGARPGPSERAGACLRRGNDLDNGRTLLRCCSSPMRQQTFDDRRQPPADSSCRALPLTAAAFVREKPGPVPAGARSTARERRP